MSSNGDEQEKAPGTLTTDEVKDEFRQFKDKLLGMPSALKSMAKGTKEEAPRQADQAQPAPGAQPMPEAATLAVEPAAEKLSTRLAGIEGRLESLEKMVAEIHGHLMRE